MYMSNTSLKTTGECRSGARLIGQKLSVGSSSYRNESTEPLNVVMLLQFVNSKKCCSNPGMAGYWQCVVACLG